MADHTALATLPAEREPVLWFELPEGFHTLDLDATPEERMLGFADAIDPLFPDASPEEKLSLVLYSEAGIEAMVDQGAVHLSHCLFRTDDDGLTQAMLAVFLQDGSCRDRTGSAERTAAAWARQEPGAEVGVVQLPYGPSAVSTQDRLVVVPGAAYGVQEDSRSVVRQLQVAVPLLSGDRTAVFLLSTEDVDQWDAYLKVMIRVLGSLSVTEPADEPVRDAPGADGGGDAPAAPPHSAPSRAQTPFG